MEYKVVDGLFVPCTDPEPCVNCKGPRDHKDFCYASHGAGRAPMCTKCFEDLVTKPNTELASKRTSVVKDNGYGGWNPETKTAAQYFGESLYTDHNILDKVPGKNGKY